MIYQLNFSHSFQIQDTKFLFCKMVFHIYNVHNTMYTELQDCYVPCYKVLQTSPKSENTNINRIILKETVSVSKQFILHSHFIFMFIEPRNRDKTIICKTLKHKTAVNHDEFMTQFALHAI